MPRSTLGLLVGLALGAVLVFGSFASMLVVALVGAVGFLVGKSLDGELDLTPYLEGRRRR